MGDTTDTTNNTEERVVPQEFYKIIKDFVRDILITFPELKDRLTDGLIDIVQDRPDTPDSLAVFSHCKSVYPERFFDILYKNDEVFTKHENIEFLPNINFVDLWKQNLSDNTREIIWKYLQLLLFIVVGEVNNGDSFGDSAKLFEAIDEEDFKKKLEETVEQMHGMFDMSGNMDDTNMPDPEGIHEHISGMLDGQIGKLAKELADETAKELDIDLEKTEDAGGLFKKMFKNPAKMMSIVKNIGSKLDSKLKSGEMNEKDLMKEASEIMNKMKNMPGMGNMQQMMNKMGGGKNMQAQMQQMMSQQSTKERMLKKLEEKKKQKEANNVVSADSGSSNPHVQSQLKKKKKKRNKSKKPSSGADLTKKENGED